jgi:hypothetical protein
MKTYIKLFLIIIFTSICFWAIGVNLHYLPFHLTDFIVSLFAFGGIIFWAEFDSEYIYKFINWIKSRKIKMDKS